MAYTFTDFKNYLKLEISQRDDLESIGGVNMYGVWINSAYKNLTTRNRFWALKRNFKFPQLLALDTTQSTSNGSPYIVVPTNALAVLNVFDVTNSRPLNRIKPGKYLDYTDRSDTDAEGEPTEWTRIGGYLYLHSTPDDEYDMEIEHRKIPADLSGTETTEIGAEWDEAILCLAAYTGFSWLHEYEKAEARKDEFIGLVSGLIGIYDIEERDAKDTLHADPMGKDYGFR